MKRRYFTQSGTEARSKEEELFDLIPESAIEEAAEYIDNEFDYNAMCETKERVLIIRAHDRFEILTESKTDYRSYEFAYNPLTGEVKYIKWGGDFK